MHTMENLRDLLENELSEIVAMGELDDHKIECIYKIVDIMKDIGEIESHDGYSEMGYRNSYRRSGRRSYRNDDMMRMDDLMSRAQNEDERNMIRRIMGM